MTREVATHQYRAFGLAIRSELPLPELPAVDPTGSEPDVEIRRGDVEPVAETDDPDDPRSIAVEPGRCRLTYETIGSIRVADGERIVVDLESESVASSKILRRLLEGQVVAVLLHQRGLLVLHASAVARDGAAAIFLGHQGAGKTTTAAACYSEGYTLLDDDVVAIEFDGDRPLVHHGVPELKLFPDPAAELGIDVSPVDEADAGSNKQYHRSSTDAERTPVPLAGCYRLGEGPEPALTAVPPRERILTLVSNTYTAGLLDTTDTTTDHFQQCSRLVEAVPVRELSRPDALDRLPELVELLSDDLEVDR